MVISMLSPDITQLLFFIDQQALSLDAMTATLRDLRIACSQDHTI
jgi:hypothetical protein